MGNSLDEKEPQLPINTRRETASIAATCKKLPEKWLHISSDAYAERIGSALAGIRSLAPDAYKKNAAEFSLDRILTNDQRVNLINWRNLILLDQVFRRDMRVLADKGGGLPQNYETFAKDQATMAAFIMVQHAENFKGKASDVKFYGSMVSACAEMSCMSFNIMDEVKKIAQNMPGALKKGAPPVRKDAPHVVDLPRAEAGAPGPRPIEGRYKECFGSAYSRLLAAVLPMMYGSYLKHNFNIGLPGVDGPAGAAGQA